MENDGQNVGKLGDSHPYKNCGMMGSELFVFSNQEFFSMFCQVSKCLFLNYETGNYFKQISITELFKKWVIDSICWRK